MRKLLLIFAVAAIFTVSASAAVSEIDRNAAKLRQELPDTAKSLMQADEPEESFLQRAGKVLIRAVGEADSAFAAAARSSVKILMVAAICTMVQALNLPYTEAAVSLAGALGVAACFAGDWNSYYASGVGTIRQLSDFSKLLIPTMAGAAALSGAISSSAAIGSLTSVIMQILVSLVEHIILPLCGVYIALCTAACALRQDDLGGLAEAVGGGMKRVLRVVFFLFTAFLSLTGILSESSDIVATRAAKMTVSASVPIAGSVLSDAASSVLAGAKVLLNSVGTFGMLSVFSIVVVPFLRLAVKVLLLDLTGFCCTALGTRQIGKLVTGLSTVMRCLLAATAGCGLMVLVSCICLLRLRVT